MLKRHRRTRKRFVLLVAIERKLLHAIHGMWLTPTQTSTEASSTSMPLDEEERIQRIGAQLRAPLTFKLSA